MNKTHYLYRHIRKDKNEPFYIGIGTCYHPTSQDWQTYYSRAYRVTKRGSFWTNVVEKTDYEVEILMESEDRGFIEKKEIEFIKLHGRKDLGTGTLVNLTDGGEKGDNRQKTPEQIEKHRQSILGENNFFYNKRHSKETKNKLSTALKHRILPDNWGDHCRGGKNPKAVKTIDINTGIIYESLKEATKAIGIGYSYAQRQVKNKGEYKGLKYIGQVSPK